MHMKLKHFLLHVNDLKLSRTRLSYPYTYAHTLSSDSSLKHYSFNIQCKLVYIAQTIYEEVFVLF